MDTKNDGLDEWLTCFVIITLSVADSIFEWVPRPRTRPRRKEW